MAQLQPDVQPWCDSYRQGGGAMCSQPAHLRGLMGIHMKFALRGHLPQSRGAEFSMLPTHTEGNLKIFILSTNPRDSHLTDLGWGPGIGAFNRNSKMMPIGGQVRESQRYHRRFKGDPTINLDLT